jgi:hypothetical protein
VSEVEFLMMQSRCDWSLRLRLMIFSPVCVCVQKRILSVNKSPCITNFTQRDSYIRLKISSCKAESKIYSFSSEKVCYKSKAKMIAILILIYKWFTQLPKRLKTLRNDGTSVQLNFIGLLMQCGLWTASKWKNQVICVTGK